VIDLLSLGRKYITLADPEGVFRGSETPLPFRQKIWLKWVKITHFDSGTPLKKQQKAKNSSGTSPFENQP
jgi:hypothetical protein